MKSIYMKERRFGTVDVKRGEIYYADMNNITGSEQGGKRPVLIIQNNIGNKYSPTTIVAVITSKHKRNLPTHVLIHKDEINGLKCDSTIALEQIRTIDKTRLVTKVGCLNENDNRKVLHALKISLEML